MRQPLQVYERQSINTVQGYVLVRNLTTGAKTYYATILPPGIPIVLRSRKSFRRATDAAAYGLRVRRRVLGFLSAEAAAKRKEETNVEAVDG